MGIDSPRRRRPRTAVIEELARLVRAAYIEERKIWESRKLSGPRGGEVRNYRPGPTWDGGRNKLTGKRLPPYWPRVVEFLLEHNIGDVRGYVAAQFQARNGMGPTPTPKNLVGPRALDIWRRHRADLSSRSVSLIHNLTTQKAVLRVELLKLHEMLPEKPAGKLLRSVLLDRDLPLTALFRYSLAVKEGLPEVASIYGTAAEVELLSDRDAYCRVWRGWIPEHFMERAGLTDRLVKEGNRG